MSLEAAFTACERNVFKLLCKLFEGGVQIGAGSTYTVGDFSRDFNPKGKKLVEGYWRDPANTPTGHDIRTVEEVEGDEEPDEDSSREMWQGKHEWIPTNMLSYVVEHAFNHNNMKWLYLVEVLRTPTRLVILNPAKGGYARSPMSADVHKKFGLSGHVGALYIEKTKGKFSALTKNQAKFHDELRGILKNHLSSKTDDPDGFVRDLFFHVGDWYWQGDTTAIAAHYSMSQAAFEQTPCPYYLLTGVKEYTSWGATMGDMAQTLKQEWAISNELLSHQIKALSSVSQSATPPKYIFPQQVI